MHEDEGLTLAPCPKENRANHDWFLIAGSTASTGFNRIQARISTFFRSPDLYIREGGTGVLQPLSNAQHRNR
jgi:hypothetical protein